MTAQEFAEFFQTEAIAGTTLKIVPHYDKTHVEPTNVSITIVILLNCNLGIIKCTCTVYHTLLVYCHYHAQCTIIV